MYCTILHQIQYWVLVTLKAKATVPLTEQMLGQIQMIYSDREEKPINKVGKMDMVDGDNAEMADKVVYESMRSTTSRSRSKI